MEDEDVAEPALAPDELPPDEDRLLTTVIEQSWATP